jgi:tripartite ATP-independent transporter DctM subunit
MDLIIPILILFLSFIILILFKVPISFALGISSLITIIYLDLPPMIVVQQLCNGLDNFSLMAIPFFILAGSIMADGGIAEILIDFSNILVGRVRGGLAMVNIIVSMFFGGMSGSSVADTSAIGSILIPMMVKKGYDKDYSTAVTITSSTQGLIIPPSHNVIIYSMAAGGVSIASLFLAGIIPGIMIGMFLMIPAYALATKRLYPKGKRYSIREALRVTKNALLGLFTIVIILGGVLSGVFTATESSAIAVVYAFCITFFVYRRVPLHTFPKILLKSTKTISMVLFLIANAAVFGWLLAYLQVPALAGRLILGISHNKYVILLLINVILLLMGMIMDMAPLILIMTPILLPIVTQVGVSPVHFGIIMMINLGIGLCTPPVGNTLYVGCAVGKISIEDETKSLWPFYLAMVAVLLLVTYVPFFAMYLPKYFFG